MKKDFPGKVTDYLDGFQYENGALQFVPTAEGYYDFVKQRYVYNYTDHLGNVRLSYAKNNNGVLEILEENNYYAFGLKHQGYGGVNLGNPNYHYKYNGKELQENSMYDYGARLYMPDIGRWNAVDPLVEKTHDPYGYVWNNPMKFIDPTGMVGESYGPGPKGSWGGVKWLKYINNWHYEDGVEFYRTNIQAREGMLKSINGRAFLNVKQTIGQWDKEYGFLPVDRTNKINANIKDVTNCYGYVLTGGYFFVDDTMDNISNFLTNSGYKSSQPNNNTSFKVGDILLWDGHMIEATETKNGKIMWESYFGFDDNPIKGELKEVMNYNKKHMEKHMEVLKMQNYTDKKINQKLNFKKRNMIQLMFKKHSNRKRKVLLVIKLLVILISLLSCKKKEKNIEFIGGKNTFVKLTEERKRMTLGKWKFTNLIYISKNDTIKIKINKEVFINENGIFDKKGEKIAKIEDHFGTFKFLNLDTLNVRYFVREIEDSSIIMKSDILHKTINKQLTKDKASVGLYFHK